jgi:hypothetical protein
MVGAAFADPVVGQRADLDLVAGTEGDGRM